MNKNISKSKLALAILSLIITFFVWQQGLKDSLDRPSVTYDLVQREKEISYFAQKVVPDNLTQFFSQDNTDLDMQEFLEESSLAEANDRNKVIMALIKDENNYFENIELNDDKYMDLLETIKKQTLESSHKYSKEFFHNFQNDKYIYHLIANKFNFDDSDVITNQFSRNMFMRIITIKLIPLITIIMGTTLVLKYIFKAIKSRTINWKPFDALELNAIDMVLLISGGFVVLGEVISPVFSMTLVDLLTKDLSFEIAQSLRIFAGYLFMALPPLIIIFYQIKSQYKTFTFKEDYLQFNYKPLTASFADGFKGFLMIIPFVLLTSLLMDSLVENQGGSNPLLEIVLNNNNYFAFILLFITTTILAPFFEEIVFRGVLLPILSRDFGIIVGVLTSSLVFAIAHLSIGELPALFILGIGLASTRLISGRLTSSIIMHSLWNGLTFLNLFLLRT